MSATSACSWAPKRDRGAAGAPPRRGFALVMGRPGPCEPGRITPARKRSGRVGVPGTGMEHGAGDQTDSPPTNSASCARSCGFVSGLECHVQVNARVRRVTTFGRDNLTFSFRARKSHAVHCGAAPFHAEEASHGGTGCKSVAGRGSAGLAGGEAKAESHEWPPQDRGRSPDEDASPRSGWSASSQASSIRHETRRQTHAIFEPHDGRPVLVAVAVQPRSLLRSARARDAPRTDLQARSSIANARRLTAVTPVVSRQSHWP